MTMKKKRFRPKKFFLKLLRLRGKSDSNKNSNNTTSLIKRHDAPVKELSTLDAAETYEPPSPSRIAVAPMLKTTTVATTTSSTASTSEYSASPVSPKIADQEHLGKASYAKSLSTLKRETVRDVIQARQDSAKKVAAEYSKDVSDWGDFPPSRKDEVPFDEQTALTKEFGASLFYADAMPNGDIEVDMIYEDLEQRRWKSEQRANRIPTQVTVETTVAPRAAEVVAPIPVKKDVRDLSFESEADPADSSLQWVVLKDGTLEMRVSPGEEVVKGTKVAPKVDPPSKSQPRGSLRNDAVTSADKGRFIGREVPGVNYSDQHVPVRKAVLKNADEQTKAQEKKKIDPPAAEATAEALTEAKKKIEQRMQERKIEIEGEKEKTQRPYQPRVQEEKKEYEEVSSPVIPVVPMVPVQKSRTTSPAATPSDPVSVRRMTSLSSNVDIAQPKQRLNSKEDPVPFRSDHSFLAMPEVGEDLTSLDGSYRTHSSRMVTQVLETDEGTEMFSTFSSTYPSFHDDDDDSDSDVFNERVQLEEEESSHSAEDYEGDSYAESLQVSGRSEVLHPPLVDDSKPRKPTEIHHIAANDSRIQEPSVSLTQIPQGSPTKQVSPTILSREVLKEQHVSQIRAAVLDRIMKLDDPKEDNDLSSKLSGNQPRRIMGRSRESVEAEQQHGSLTPEVPVPPVRRGPALWSPYSYDTDDGTRSVVSTPGTETDASSYASSSVMRSFTGDDISYADDTSYSRMSNPRRSGYMSDGTEDDVVSTVNLGSELTEMASELRVKGPAVLMDWLDLR